MSNNPTSEKLTFRELVDKHKIEIPIIQRDYAQGREDQEKLRKNFLRALLEAIKGKELELDFVYGSVKDDVFQPLDGQQRLTTLFLLHWFIAIKENKLDDELKNLLTKFTYETRTSSREFCNDLINKGIVYNSEEKISELIINCSWFFLSWKRDPTIKSMLTMLDDIQQTFQNETEVLDKLNKISFHYIELQNFGLSDDLYIKMNARGKALTNFENFKAKFEQHIIKENWESNIKETDKFSYKIDTIWTDLFWKYRSNDGLIDNEFIRFIAGIAINNYAQNLEIIENKDEENKIKLELESKSKGKSVSNDVIKRERIERKIQLLFNTPAEITPSDFPNEKAFKYLVDSLDKYSIDQNDKVLPILPLWDHCKIEDVKNGTIKIENNLFFKFINKGDVTYKQRLLFYAQTQYLLSSNEFNEQYFSHWIRVIRNIVENSTIDSSQSFIGAIGLVNELSEGCTNIYKYLVDNEIKSNFASSQTSEEKTKASIMNFDENKEIIFQTEDTKFCKGRITFALDCIGFQKDNSESFSFDKLNEVQKVIKNHLEGIDITNDFRRGLLTIQDNQFYNYRASYLHAVNAPKRCLIANIMELKQFAYNVNYKKYLIELVRKLTECDLNTIISKYKEPDDMPNWKKRLIKEEKLLDYSEQHYIAIKDDQSCCWLIPKSKVINTKEGKNKCKLIK